MVGGTAFVVGVAGAVVLEVVVVDDVVGGRVVVVVVGARVVVVVVGASVVVVVDVGATVVVELRAGAVEVGGSVVVVVVVAGCDLVVEVAWEVFVGVVTGVWREASSNAPMPAMSTMTAAATRGAPYRRLRSPPAKRSSLASSP